ncbi:MAG: arsenate reductase ArsC [Magnetococcales bacterium]|nr:arsenate reductase ArsC [Magnetococcales bacterium]
MADKLYHVLFLCTGNSARSIMAQAILEREGKGRFVAYSAGSRPIGQVNPDALRVLTILDHPIEHLHSKSWLEFSQPNAPQMDFIFTVCDQAAKETCPVWIGQPLTASWGVPDPAAVVGNIAEKAAAFNETYRLLLNRITLFVNLPLASLDRHSLENRVTEIGIKPQPTRET